MTSFKYRKDFESLFYCIFMMFNVIFSILYHTYHVPDIADLQDDSIAYMKDQQYIWTYLDAKYSGHNIIITAIYTFRIRPPYFWLAVIFT